MKLPKETPEEEQNEYYGPIDGICLEDYIETYKKLLDCFCLKKYRHDEVIYVERMYPRIRLCKDCYNRIKSA